MRIPLAIISLCAVTACSSQSALPSVRHSQALTPKQLADNCALGTVNGSPLSSCVGATFFPPSSAGGLYDHAITSPTVDANSAAMIADNFGSTGGPNDDTFGLMWHNGVGQQSNSYGRPFYLAKTSDPLVTVNCDQFCGPFGYTTKIHIPAHALAEGGTDHHISVYQPNNNLNEFWAWEASPPYTNGENVYAGSMANTKVDGTTFSQYDLQPGWMSNAVTAGGMVGVAGVITLAELQAHSITHELYGVVACTAANWYYPATQTARVCTDGRTAIPDGALLHYKPTCAQINANNALGADEKTVDCAMHTYGVRISDDGICDNCHGMSIQVENQASFWSYGTGADPFIGYAITAGWNHIVNGSIDRYAVEFTNSNYPSNMEVLAPGN